MIASFFLDKKNVALALGKQVTIVHHSHTWRCHHAEGTVEDYVQEGIKHHVEILGISDHTPFPEKLDEGIRMDQEEFPEYIKEIEPANKKSSIN